MTDEADRVEAQLREAVGKWLEETIVLLHSGPGAPDFPMSVMLVGSTSDPATPTSLYMLLCDATYPGRSNGWAQALHMTRDMITLMMKMDNDFGLGMNLLPALAAAHPLFQGYARGEPVDGSTPGGGKLH